MELPVEPVLADYGLSNAELAALPKRRFGLDNIKMLLWVGAVIFIAISASLFDRSHIGSSLALIALTAIVFTGFGSFLAAAILLGLLGLLEENLLRRINPKYGKAADYKQALVDYEKRKRGYEAWLRKLQADWWRSLSGIAFEDELGKLFKMMGYDVSHTPRTGDGGVDLLARKNGRLTVVQCKAHNKRIPIGVARELVASMSDFKASDAIIACYEGVTKPVEEYIKGKRISVLTLPQIVELQRLHGNYRPEK